MWLGLELESYLDLTCVPLKERVKTFSGSRQKRQYECHPWETEFCFPWNGIFLETEPEADLGKSYLPLPSNTQCHQKGRPISLLSVH